MMTSKDGGGGGGGGGWEVDSGPTEYLLLDISFF